MSYTVTPGPALTVTPSSLSFEVNEGAGNPAPQAVTLSPSGGAPAWTATVGGYTGADPGWLSVNPTADPDPGDPTDLVTFNVASAGLSAGARSATVTFTAGALTRTVTVTLAVNAAAVNFVAPYVAIAGAPGNVIIRGNALTGATAVNFGGNAATAFTVVSDTEIRATHPALGVGTYAVNVTAPSTPTRRAEANLVVINAPALAAASIDRPMPRAGVGNLIYDAERQALYLIDADNARIERYRFAAGIWQPVEPFAIGGGGGNPRIALSPDGTQLLQTGGSSLARRNAATFAALASVDATPFLGAGATNFIGFGNDGRAVLTASSQSANVTLFRYDMLTQTFSGFANALATQPDMVNRSIHASADGDTLMLPTFEPLAPGFFRQVISYDASAGALTQQSETTSGTEHASLSRDGSRVIMVSSPNSAAQVTTVYDFTGGAGGALVVRGTLPSAALSAFVISPDGSTAYAYVSGTVRKYDLTPNPAGGPFVETANVPAASPGTFFSRMAISPDGGWLFLAGNQRVVILPAP